MADVTDEFRRMREWGLVVATSRLERGLRARDAGARLTIADNRLLWLLTNEGPRTMREISEQLCLEQSTVNRQVNAALARGLVERGERSGEAARAVRITGEGADLFAAELKRSMGVFGQGLDALPEDERKRFTEQFLRFALAFCEAADALPARPV